jgi:hypothetical protein
MSGLYEWAWEPGFTFEVTHIGGDTPVAMEVGFGLKPKGSQLMFMVKTTAPKEWVALSGNEVRLLSEILEFFESHRVYFTPTGQYRHGTSGLVLCSGDDYEPFIDALTEYRSLTLADDAEAERLLDKAAANTSKQANVLLKVITTFVDQADIISQVEEGDHEPYPPESDDTDAKEAAALQREQVDLAVQGIIEMRRDLITELDSL